MHVIFDEVRDWLRAILNTLLHQLIINLLDAKLVEESDSKFFITLC